MSAIDDYLNTIKPKYRGKLERIRRIAKEVVPNVQEVISYGMPTLQYKGKSFLGFSIHNTFIGIYPYGGEEIEIYKNQLSQFGLSKGSIRVPFDKELPENLLKDIIVHRIKRITDL